MRLYSHLDSAIFSYDLLANLNMPEVVHFADDRLNLFEPVGYLDSSLNTYVLEVPTKTSLDNAQSLEWTVEPDASAYSDLYNSAIYLRGKYVKEDNTNLAATDV